jgi:hypothetical protein
LTRYFLKPLTVSYGIGPLIEAASVLCEFSAMNSVRSLQSIVGEQLSSITFVQDYWQFHFDGPSLTALTRVEVQTKGLKLSDGSDQFRNVLCGQIGKIITQVNLIQPEALTITFEDRSSISISLRWDDYRGPEAVNFWGRNGAVVVIRADG